MFARLYHAHYQTYTEDFPFWLELGGADACLLELGCGTGRVAIPLAEAGRSVWGVDRDLAMLNVAVSERDRLPPDVRDRLHFWQADMRDLNLGKVFDLIILPCNTYSTLEKEEREKVLTRSSVHLNAGGVFAVGMPNPIALQAYLGTGEGISREEGNFRHPQTGNPVQVSARVEGLESSVIWTWHYDHLLPDGRVERLTRSTRHEYQSAEAYREELERHGFQVQGMFGGYDRRAFTPESPYLILVAGKKVE
jgi:SAM-dependent methyltransferase